MDLPRSLYDYYNQSSIDKCLDEIMLEKNGCDIDAPAVHVCKFCEKKLLSDKLPQTAVANGLFYGRSPDFLRNLNRTECSMLNWSIPCIYLTTIAGGANMCLRSHSYQLINANGPVAAQLPNNILGKGVLSVSILGGMSTTQRMSVKRQYEARCEPMIESLNWLKACGNPYYKDLDLLQASKDIHIISEKTNEEIVTEAVNDPESSVDEAMNRFNLQEDKLEAVSTEEETTETARPSVIVDTTPTSHIQISKSNTFLSDYDPTYWVKSFVELFPYRRGGFDEPR
jgi:hypothetical protein